MLYDHFKIKKIFCLFLFVCVFFAIEGKEEVKAGVWDSCPEVEAASAAIIDVETGTILIGKNLEKKRFPASVTKVMTALLTLNHMKSMEDRIVFNKVAVTAEDLNSKTLWLKEGEILTLRDCLYGLLLESANDIAKGLAFYVGGSIEKFAEKMNEKAKELGCVNTHFTNPHGLSDEEHYTCAADMAKIMRACALNPRFCEIAGTSKYSIPKTNKFEYARVLYNDSKMLHESSPYYYKKCYGAKTGFTDEARKTYVALAKKGKHRLAGVILGTNSLVGQYKGLESMFEHCFDQFKLIRADKLPFFVTPQKGDLYEKILQNDSEAKFKVEKNRKIVVPKKYDEKKLETKVTYLPLRKIRVGVNHVGDITYHYDGKEVGTARLYYGSYNEFKLK